MNDLSGLLYAVENWGGQYAVARFVQDAPNHFSPKWTAIDRPEYERILRENIEFEADSQPCYSIRFYDLEAQRQAASFDDVIAALDEQNELTAAAMMGVL